MDRQELTYIFIISILFTLSFPPFPWGVMVPFALAIFIWLIHDKEPRDSFRLGYWVGFFWGTGTLYWIGINSVPGAVLVISINALHYALLAGLFSFLYRNKRALALFSLPFIWVSVEYLRYFTDIRFNWLSLAYTQTYYLNFIQISEITGLLFISFILVCTAISIFLLYKNRTIKTLWSLLVMLFIILLLNGYGMKRIDDIDQKIDPLINAAFVQPNVDPFLKWDPEFQDEMFNSLLKESKNILSEKPDIIIWPETATPFYLRTRFKEIRQINQLIDSVNIYLLTGSPDYLYDKEKNEVFTYNAAFFFRPNTLKFESYYKLALVPGSETIPFKKWFPLLRKIDVGGGDFFPGKQFTTFDFTVADRLGARTDSGYQVIGARPMDSTTVQLSAIICFESVFPHIVRRFILNGANLLTVITNDGWFGTTSGPYQHAQYAVYRAIENRVSIIRSANTGISGFIDPAGRWISKTALNRATSSSGFIPIATDKTFYTLYGEWFAQLSILISIIIIFYVFSAKKILRS
jgi:apolipoprotein N-acyltransferase